MRRALVALLAVVDACSNVPTPVPPTPPPAASDAIVGSEGPAAVDAAADAAVVPDAAVAVAVPQPAEPEVWLKGSTHVHARPSGDSSEPIPSVIQWYEKHGYDFIVLTDHNQVSEVDKTSHTPGAVAVRTPPPGGGLIVIAGSELTHNPSGCVPAGDKSKKCRIHLNAIGVTARPTGKQIDWAEKARKTHDRLAKYELEIGEAKTLGAAVMQVNHPQWFWGMTGDLLAELAARGVRLVEIANVQFLKWSAGDKDHDSMEVIWDKALSKSAAPLWAVASDDAHDYTSSKKAKYPAGGGWIVVRAHRDPQAILDAMVAGHFYASTGVELVSVEIDAQAHTLSIEAAAGHAYVIDFVEGGAKVATVKAAKASRAIPANGYVRAVITRDDGKQAWVQPARRTPPPAPTPTAP